MNNNSIETPAAAVENPQPAATLSPEAIVEQLRTLRTQIGELTPLTPAQRKALRLSKTSNEILQSSINVIDGANAIEQAVGQPAGEVRGLLEESNRWTAVEDELRTLLHGVAGANLVRRHRVGVLADRAYVVGAQLARDPVHVTLVSQVHEIKRLKRIARRKKTQAPDTPPAPGAETSNTQKP